MSEAIQHTPGPWVFEYCAKSGATTIIAPEAVRQVGCLIYSDGCIIADLGQPGGARATLSEPTEEEFEANANLIIAAPEMLKAFREIAADPHVDSHGLATRAQDIARKMIEIAEGKR